MSSKRLIFILCFIAFQIHAQEIVSFNDDKVASIDSALRFYSPNKPGGQLSISLKGRVVYSKAWGLADLEHRVPMTTETRIEAGSVSKQFTAAAILLLEKQGKLTLDDPVNLYLPELPVYQRPIRIRHLIHHTSGLREWGDVAELAGWPNSLRILDNGRVFEIICRQKKLNSPPGEQFRYSNSNYILLAILVEKVSGSSFADFTGKFIFQPAGMTHTQWRNDYTEVVPMRSTAYDIKDGRFCKSMPENNIHGSGGLLTTAEDLLKWSEFYLSARLGGNALRSKQIGLDTASTLIFNTYAAGLFIEGSPTKRVFQHGGATAGYRAKLICLPDTGLSIAWLSNTSTLDTTGRDPALEVAGILVGPTYLSPPQEKEKVENMAVNIEKLNRYVGLYKSSHSARDVDISLGPHGLLLSGTLLKPITEKLFRFHDILLSFDTTKELVVYPSSSEPMRYHKTDMSLINPIHSESYVGNYYSKEVGGWVKIRKKNKRLIARFASGGECELINYFVDGFIAPCDLKADLFFKRGSNHEVTSLEVNTQRAYHIDFVKIKNRKALYYIPCIN
ncbi:serine hydrolase domain-containing protein [Larkinella humicola]|uniref:Beta-lactamase family protein n=1 Tax=Larkinella humicola TaxID=2607654 RepID=A0A5N1J3J3_9BACT|nr:serine hydrolase domain-containing protein [Larkinella humicola]KAA9345466.1 beta-lactamase family protein [Larkinella humicola]